MAASRSHTLRNSRVACTPASAPEWPARLARGLARALLAGMLVLLAGCERQVVQRDYFPFRDGNRWEYRMLNQRQLEALKAGADIQTAPAASQAGAGVNREVADLAEIYDLEKGEPAAKTANKSGKPSAEGPHAALPPARRVTLELKEKVNELTYRALYGDSEQVWSKDGGYLGFQSGEGRHYLLILPPHTAYRWIVTDQRNENQYFEIESHGDLTTPAGVFRDCAVTRQESRDKRIIFRYWFAEGTGLVRRSKYFLDEEVFRQELIEFNVKPSTLAGREAEEREVVQALKGKNRGREFMKKDERRKDGVGTDWETPAPGAP